MKRIFLRPLLCIFITCNIFNSIGQNTKSGTNALVNNTTGTYNTAIGYYSMFTNTTGYNNTAGGAYSLYSNTSGNHNAANGYLAMYHNTTGVHNTASGAFAMYSNTTGFSNAATGFDAMYNNTSGAYNTAYGMYSLNKNTTGSNNSAVGYAALYTNTTGYENTANGEYALNKNTTGWGNTASGSSSLYANTTGWGNTANGFASLFYNTLGIRNTAYGHGALYYNTTASYNTAVGDNSLNLTSTGGFNTAIGNFCLSTNTTGSNNTAIGDSADVLTNNLKNATAIGYKAVVDKSNKVRVGNTSVTSIGGQVGWTTYSDGRFKKDIKENVPGLVFINSLRPITYTVNVKGITEFYNKGRKQINNYDVTGNENKTPNEAIDNGEDAASKITYNGFVAQEVEAAADKINYDFSGVDKPETKDGLYGLRYDNFIAPLVKAVQELSQQNSELKKEIEELKSVVLPGNQSNFSAGKNTTILSSAFVEQNIPNPFANTTTINYNLPAQYSSAKMVITDKNSKTLKEINISGRGKGTLNINAAILASGAYNYSLYVDGRLIGTKQMELAK